MNNIVFYSCDNIENNDPFLYLVKKKTIPFEMLLKDLNAWHEEIASIILDLPSLFYYENNRPESLLFHETLSVEQKEETKSLLKNLLNNPEHFEDFFIQHSLAIEEVVPAITIEQISGVMQDYGFDLPPNDGEEVGTYKKRCLCFLKADNGYGLFGEILFYTVCRVLLNKDLLLSKIAFITSGGTTAHGSDGIFYDSANDTLIFGESKFTTDLSQGLRQASKSLSDLDKRFGNDGCFIYKQILTMKGEYRESFAKMSLRDIQSKKKEVLVFVLHGQDYKEKDILKQENEFYLREISNCGTLSVISFPIISKNNLIRSVAKGIDAL